MNACDCASEFMQTPLSDCSFLKPAAGTNRAVLARIYTAKQVPGELFSLCSALTNGTVYPELYQPYGCENSCSPGCGGEAILPEEAIPPCGCCD